MLDDDLRNGLLTEAITRVVNQETAFLDVGAGTGVWAILAAKLGAKRVVAIEIEEALIPIIYKNAKENGVAERVEIIHANSDDAKIRGKFDVIVSELFGSRAFGPETIASFVSVRDRFLGENGVLIPQSLEMFAAPAKRTVSKPRRPILTSYFDSLVPNQMIGLNHADRGSVKLLAEGRKLTGVDFRTVTDSVDLSKLSARWEVEDLSEVDSIVTFDRSTFLEDLVMDNLHSRSWGMVVLPVEPLPAGKGSISLDLNLDEHRSIWTVSASTSSGPLIRSYSTPMAAARLKMASKMTPHKRHRPKKSRN